jgi:beta-lactamase class A
MKITPVPRRSVLAAGAAVLVSKFASAASVAVQEYERSTRGRVGLFATNLESRRQIAWRANERFAMCSTFKTSLAALMLARVDAGQERLQRPVAFGASDLLAYAPVAKAHLPAGSMTIETMCQAAVELSDNTCANLLLREAGGPPALTRYWRDLGDDVSRLDHDEPLLNRTKPGQPQDTTTPAAMAHTIGRLTTARVLTTASRARLIGWMVACQTGAAKLRAGLPREWRIGDKTGNNGGDAAGDLAIAWPPTGAAVVICAYVQGGTSTAQQQDQLFAAIGRLVAEQLA